MLCQYVMQCSTTTTRRRRMSKCVRGRRERTVVWVVSVRRTIYLDIEEKTNSTNDWNHEKGSRLGTVFIFLCNSSSCPLSIAVTTHSKTAQTTFIHILSCSPFHTLQEGLKIVCAISIIDKLVTVQWLLILLHHSESSSCLSFHPGPVVCPTRSTIISNMSLHTESD